MNEPAPIQVHKALADDTRYRLYRYLRLSGRAVPVRELATSLGLHENTVRPHLRRLIDVGLVTAETRRTASAVGRPQTLYAAVGRPGGREGRDYRLLADILATLATGSRAVKAAEGLAREWGDYLMTTRTPPPGARRPGPDLAALQEAMAEAGFDPRFRRRGGGTVEIALRTCPFRDLLDEHRELACTIHRGLLEGMLEGARPRLRLRSFEPLADRSTVCRLVAGVEPAPTG
jgi:predicted ArsR family transcriptional regulator